MSATDNIKNLQMLLDTLSADHLGREEFTKAFKQVLDFVKSIDARNVEDFKQVRQVLSDLAEKVKANHEMLTNELKGQVNDVFVGDQMKRMKGELDMSSDEMKKMCEEKMAEMERAMNKKMSEMKNGDMGPMGKQGMPGRPPTTEEMMMAMKPMMDEHKKEMEQMKEAIRQTAVSKRMGMRKIPVIKRIDLSSQTNGTLRAFTLPRDTVAVIAVAGTDFPMTFSDSDFTFSGNTLTLSSSFDAPQQGATLICLIETLFY